MYTIDVFLCQSDKEKHMRIGEILISPILKLLSRIRWITSWLMEVTQDGGGLQLRWISLRTCSSVASAQGIRIADWSVSRALRVNGLTWRVRMFNMKFKRRAVRSVLKNLSPWNISLTLLMRARFHQTCQAAYGQHCSSISTLKECLNFT